MKAIICVLVTLLAVSCYGAPAADLVTNLPGLNFETNYSQYSGYLQASPNRFLHYWFIESQNDPSTDPIVLWLNGGPGCSSLLGLFTELGPFYVDQAGSGELHPNPYSWNTFANFVYLESPACVGFSYDTTDDCSSNDNITAEQNYVALQDFFINKFPEFQTREFYITGESYAGIYIPTLVKLIVDGLDEFPVNFQGFAIGNGLLDWSDNDNSIVFFAYNHAIIGDSLWNNLLNECCDGNGAGRDNCQFHESNILNPQLTVECQTYVDEVLIRVDFGLNPYNLLAQCGELANSSPTLDSRLNVEMRTLRPNFDIESLYRYRKEGTPKDIIDIDTYDPACSDNSVEINYLNDPATKTALNIAAEARDWKPCSNEVNLRYRRNLDSTIDLVAYGAERSRALIFNGDVDMACNFLGNEWSVEDLGLPVVESRKKWTFDGQIAGYVKRFANLDFLTIRGAGHMVPAYKPPEALKMIKSFIENTPY